MAIAKIEITCTNCGCTFTHRRECRNFTEANSYKQWAVENITTCPACHRKAAMESAIASLETTLCKLGIVLPPIDGVSEKQIAYACSVRQRVLSSDIRAIEKYHRGMSRLQSPETLEKTRKACEEHGITLEEKIDHDLKRNGLYRIHIAITSTSAREILDKLVG